MIQIVNTADIDWLKFHLETRVTRESIRDLIGLQFTVRLYHYRFLTPHSVASACVLASTFN